jgi:hypothetical protein
MARLLHSLAIAAALAIFSAPLLILLLMQSQ